MEPSQIPTKLPNRCEDCAKIDLKQIFEIAYKRHPLEQWEDWKTSCLLVASLGDRPSPSAACSLCRLFWHLRAPIGSSGQPAPAYLPSAAGTLEDYDRQDRGYELIAYSHPLWNRKMAWPASLNVFFAVVPSGVTRGDRASDYILSRFWMELGTYPLLCRASPKDATGARESQIGNIGRAIDSEVDFSVARQWLEQCRERHKEQPCCDRPQLKWGAEGGIRGFRLINCSTTPPTVERRSGKELYAALSYVWGEAGRYSTEKWPKVILDAIEVTKQLGLTYLWVDKYCIDQDGLHKASQIRAMNKIYRGAEVTIFAAAGDDANHGLAGVRGTPRNAQYQVSIGDTFLVSTFPEPKQTIQDSVWASRGWIYQEAVLSRRKLFFTKDQMFWLCEEFMAEESIDSCWDDTWGIFGVRSGSVLRCNHDGEAPSGVSRSSHASSPYLPLYDFEVFPRIACTAPSYEHAVPSLWEHIRHYSPRNLTFEGDAIKAFKGVTEHFNAVENGGLDTVLGLPVYCNPDKTGQYHVSRSLVLSLCWISGAGKTPRALRREEFPSWTWVGWKHPAEIHDSLSGKYGNLFSLLVGPEATCKFKHSWTQDIALLDPITGLMIDLANIESVLEEGDTPLSKMRVGEDEDERFLQLYLPSPSVITGEDLYQWFTCIKEEANIEPPLETSNQLHDYDVLVWLGGPSGGGQDHPQLWEAVRQGQVQFVMLYQQAEASGDVSRDLFLILERPKKAEETIWERIGLLEVCTRAGGRGLEEFRQMLGMRQLKEPVIIG